MGENMAEGQGEALATIGEIAQGHGDIRAAISAARRSPLERLLRAWVNEVDDVVVLRPYQATAIALAVGLLGGLAIAAGTRRRPYSRGW
jgi:ElaB/YqjD/DUF883 family membrane-anchored ribosome-binding protein